MLPKKFKKENEDNSLHHLESRNNEISYMNDGSNNNETSPSLVFFVVSLFFLFFCCFFWYLAKGFLLE